MNSYIVQLAERSLTIPSPPPPPGQLPTFRIENRIPVVSVLVITSDQWCVFRWSALERNRLSPALIFGLWGGGMGLE